MKFSHLKELDNNNRISVKIKGRIRTPFVSGEEIALFDKNKNQLVVKVISYNSITKELEAKKLLPCIYVWTTRSYELTNTYKVGLVNWQSVDKRIDQTDTTGVLEKIEVRFVLPLDVYNPKITKEIENTIHKKIGLSRTDKQREAVQAEYSFIEKTIIDVVNEFKVKQPNLGFLPIPRYFQKDASEIASSYYKDNDRGWIQWTCGSGKSYGSYWIYESVKNISKFNKNLVVILVPNRQLVLQTHDDWVHVASKSGNVVQSIKIGGVSDSIKDVGEISRWISSRTNKTTNVIVSTYQSSHLISKALKLTNDTIDFTIYDEVHRLTGNDSKVWKKTLYDSEFPSNKRLSMTASPIEYTDTSKGFSGMENEQMFGKKFHTYSFLDAQFDGYIAPLEIRGITADSNVISSIEKFTLKNEKIIQKNMIDYDIDLDDVDEFVNTNEGNLLFFIQLHNTLTLLKEGEITHPIIYANSTARITRFMATLKAMAPSYGVNLEYTNIFSHKDKSIKHRIYELENKFSKSKIGVVGNVYCLQEGISINQVDSVVMLDPRQSGPSIIQILGRPVRLNGKDKKAKIILPIIVKEENGLIKLDKDYFEMTTRWMISLSSADSDLLNIVLSEDITDKEREGIDVKDIKTKKRNPSISGLNRNPSKTSYQLEEIDFTDFKKTSQFKKIIDTKTSVAKIKNTENGKKLTLDRNVVNYVLTYETKIENAIRNYEPKKHNKYIDLIKDFDGYAEEFSMKYSIDYIKSKKLLKETKIDKVINLSNKLKRKNILNSFKLF